MKEKTVTKESILRLEVAFGLGKDRAIDNQEHREVIFNFSWSIRAKS
ncbi:hypothetical protein ACIQYF_10925 [Pseudomonas sp. NPDC096917]